MVFSSTIFIFIFLPILLLLYFLAWKIRLKLSNIVLLLASTIFILWGSGRDIFVLFFIICINYIAGLLLTKGKEQKRLEKNGARTSFQKTILFVALAASIGVLIFFKYALFLAENAVGILEIFGYSFEPPAFLKNVILPLGISFYTFQALSYSIDVYLGNVDRTNSLFNFALYVSFFPQLIAGPIVRYSHFYKQINQREIKVSNIYNGLIRFMGGFIKKILLANIVAKAADGVFALPASELHFSIVWVGILAYTLQIYLDFSAYSDMAIGLAEVFGFSLRENFNLPYVSTSVQDFWRRWHISLSSWFRDYLYIPLGGNRKGRYRTYINLIIVFIICGIWHGAAWTFILWGAWHGAFLVMERAFLSTWLQKLPIILRRLYTMCVVILGWVIFRAPDLRYTLSYIKIMFYHQEFKGELFRNATEFLQSDIIIVFIFGILSSMGFFMWIKKTCDNQGAVLKNIYAAATIILFFLSITSIYSGAYNPFIYFRF